ncbi:MAG: PKD domain-containing protein [Vicingaceae bacterium]|nr:MAG: PKD domain-containing protein [Vicingaceae bacterium]
MLHAQNNNSCQTAAILNPVLECNSPQTFVFGNGQTEQWFSFNTGSSQFFILEYAIHSSYYKYSVDLFSGNCNSNLFIKTDTLANYVFLDELFYENLDSNTQHYIRINKLSNSNTNDTITLCLNNKNMLDNDFEACITLDPLSNIFGWCCAQEGEPIKNCSWEESGIGCYNTPFTVKSSYGGAGIRIVWTLPGAVIIKDWVGNNSSLSVTNYTIPSGFYPPGSGNWVLAGVSAEYFKEDGFGNYYPLNKKISITFSVVVPHAEPHFEIVGNGPFCMGDEVCFDFYSNNTETKDIFTTIGIFEPYIPFFSYPDPVINSHTGGIGILTETKCFQYLSPGIYTPTLTTENACGIWSKTLTLEIGPYPKFEVPEPLCAGQEFTFNNTTNCLQYVQSWFWDFGDGFSSTQPNPSHTYANPGTYTVQLCLTDANGDQYCITQSVEVHPSPAPPVILGNLFVCDPVSEYCVQNPQPGYTYWWNITNGFPQSYNGPCVEVNWNQNGSGFLTVIATNEFGCIAVTDKEVAECCYKLDTLNPGTEINLYNTSASFIINNILGGSTTWTTNTYINLNGVMEIDQDFTFSNCPNIYLGQNARINIPAGKKLRIENASKLEAACPDKMWDGIYLQTFTSQLEADFSTFMHAQNAIISQNGAKYTITSSTFNQNWIGIKVEPFPFNHQGMVTAGAFGPTGFLCTAPLMYPHLDKRSHAGMLIERVGNQGGNITVGSSLLFDNQNTGILADQSYLTVIGSTFQNMGIVQGQGGGIGVHAMGGKFNAQTLVGGANANQNNFNNCFIGVLIEGWQQAEVSHNTFNSNNNGGGTGISVKNVTNFNIPIPYKNIIIAQNQINNYQTGINLYSNMNAKVSVLKNNINQQGIPFGTGITAQEMPISITFNLTYITDNTITAPATGIMAGGLRNAQISENNVSQLKQNNLFNTYGVLLRGCFNARVNANTVSSQNPSTNPRQHGYAFEMSEATLATCNEADKTGTGMRCAGAMPSTNLWGNTFKNNHTGFRLAGNGLIGPQFRNTPGNEWASDNKWIGNHTDRSNASGSNELLSPFYVRQVSGGGIFNPNFNSTFFLSLLPANGPQFKCAIINNPEVSANPAKKKLLQEIAQAQLNLPQPDTAIWHSQLAAYLTIRENQQLLADTVLSNFYDSMQVSNPRQLQLIDSQMFDSANCNNTLLAACNAINPANIQEQWLKDIAIMYISSRLLGDTFTTQQIQQLQYIASLCPYTDGMAVYQARFLLAEFDSLAYENNCELDINGNGQRLAPEEDENTVAFTESVSIKIYPNPSNGIIHIESTTDITSIEIFNAIGGIVLGKTSDKRQIDIDAKNLPLGLYTIRVRTSDIIYNSKVFLFR